MAGLIGRARLLSIDRLGEQTADGQLRRFAGALCDKMGFRTASFTFLTFIFLGQVLVATSATVDSYYLLLAGRFVFALGGEGYTVAHPRCGHASEMARGLPLSRTFAP